MAVHGPIDQGVEDLRALDIPARKRRPALIPGVAIALKTLRICLSGRRAPVALGRGVERIFNNRLVETPGPAAKSTGSGRMNICRHRFAPNIPPNRKTTKAPSYEPVTVTGGANPRAGRVRQTIGGAASAFPRSWRSETSARASASKSAASWPRSSSTIPLSARSRRRSRRGAPLFRRPCRAWSVLT